MKVLILGGTGTMGSYLGEFCLQNNFDTHITTRRKLPSTSSLTYIKGNAQDLTFLESILEQNWDAIIDFMVYESSSFLERRDKLLQSCSQYVFISSARVYSNCFEAIKESQETLLHQIDDNEFLSTKEYSLEKSRQEELLKSSKYQNWTIVRPYITYSTNQLQLGAYQKEEWLYRAIKGRSLVFSKSLINTYTTLTHGKDVARGIFKLINHKKSVGETFHITAIEPVKWCEILDLYRNLLTKHLGYSPQVILLEDEEFKKSHKSTYQLIYDRFYDRKFDNSKISEFLETEKFILPENGLKECLNEFLQNPSFKRINWKVEAIKDKLSKEHTSIFEIIGVKEKIKYLFFRYISK